MPTASLLKPNNDMSWLGVFSDNHPCSVKKDSRKDLQPHPTGRTVEFSASGELCDRPLLLPMRQLSHCNMNCVMENSISDLSTSARFGIAEHDQPILAPPMRQISKSISSNLLLELFSPSVSNSDSSSTRSLFNENDQSALRQISQSLSSLLEEDTESSFHCSDESDDPFRATAATVQIRLEMIVD